MSKQIMTLGVFAHANAGKTTLTEQLLVHTKVKKNVGRVDYGNTTTDNMKVEQERGISVKSSLVTIPLGNKLIQLIDTPGHVDFSAEVERAISVLDGAILVVSGVEGVEPQTQVIWNILRQRNVPTLIFINKMDRMGADYDRTLQKLQQKLDNRILPKVKVYKNNLDLQYEDIPSTRIIEQIADIDEGVLEKFVQDDTINLEWLNKKVEDLSKKGKLFYVYGGSALLNDGMLKLIEGIDQYLPVSESKVKDKFSGYIYTVKCDGGTRELYVKILAGNLKNREEIECKDGSLQRVRSMTKIHGFNREKTDELKAGEIGIITGIDAKCGDLIGNKQTEFMPVSFVNPLFQTTVNVINPNDILKLISALEILNDEDPELQISFNKQTGQINIKLMGLLQAEIINNILLERFGLATTFSDPIIVHKETPIRIGHGEANYTRVSGVVFEVKPLPRGSGIVYQSKFSTDYLFSKYQKQVERLVKYYVKQGLYGWEVTDVEISLIGGKCDHVGSDPSHYNIAVPIALMRAFKDAGMMILEPNMFYEINTSETSYKSVLSAVSNLGILYDSIVRDSGNVKMNGIAPLREIVDLPTIITKLTGGCGSVIEKPYGYIERTDQKIVERKYCGSDPRNEEAFLLNMGASFDNLDARRRRR